MKLTYSIRVYALVLLALATIAGYTTARADDCKGHSCNDGGDTVVDTTVDVTGGDVNVPVDVNTNVTGAPVNVQHRSDSFALGLSNGLGDVDIAGCLGSVQFSTPIYGRQKLVVNWPCLAEFYLRNGKYQLAAMAICNTEVVKEFESEEACEAAHDFGPLPAPEPVMPPASLLEQRQEIESLHEEDIQMVQMQQQDLVARIDQIEERLSRPPARPARIVEQKPAFSEAQIAAAWTALGGNESKAND